MMDLVNNRIKSLYGTKFSFCEKNGYVYKDLASKLRTLQNRICWVNDFLKPLSLEIRIVDTSEKKS